MSAGIDAKVLSSSPAGAILTGDVIIPQTNRLRLPSESDYTEEDTFGSNDNDQTIFKKMFLKSQAIGLESYKMNLKQRGYAIIVNNENFHPITRMNKRTGTDVDAKNLKRIYRKLGFMAEAYKDLTCRQLRQLMEELARIDHSGKDCLAFAILSHGDKGCVYGTDGTITIKELVDMFRGEKCPSLAGKPKIFIFQACRGTEHEDPVYPAKDVADGIGEADEEEENVTHTDAAVPVTIPSASDFLFCYSVIEGFYSHRDTLYGSWYVQEFVHAVESLIFKNDGEPVDFLDVLTLVNRNVAARSVERSMSAASIGKKQMPCYLSMLTKKLYLMKKEKPKQ